VVHDAILHLLNEQPLLVDLESLPGAGDTAVVCTNLRMTSGKRPVWVDRAENWFVFPMTQVRFLEVPGKGAGGRPTGNALAVAVVADEPDLELDEELLRRIRET
jgi:hypothetical protein